MNRAAIISLIGVGLGAANEGRDGGVVAVGDVFRTGCSNGKFHPLAKGLY